MTSDFERYCAFVHDAPYRKDPRAFFPLSLPSTAVASALALELLSGGSGLPWRDDPVVATRPTTGLAFLFYVTPGMRRLGWDRARREKFASGLLDAVSVARSGQLLNDDGRHLVWAPQTAAGRVAAATPADRDLRRLTGAAFLVADLAFGPAHRLLLESHGPYSAEGRWWLVRSVHLDGVIGELPELAESAEQLRSVDVLTEVENPHRRWFDPWANLVAEVTPGAACRVSVTSRTSAPSAPEALAQLEQALDRAIELLRCRRSMQPDPVTNAELLRVMLAIPGGGAVGDRFGPLPSRIDLDRRWDDASLNELVALYDLTLDIA